MEEGVVRKQEWLTDKCEVEGGGVVKKRKTKD